MIEIWADRARSIVVNGIPYETGKGGITKIEAGNLWSPSSHNTRHGFIVVTDDDECVFVPYEQVTSVCFSADDIHGLDGGDKDGDAG